MTVRARPTKPFNEAELQLIKERQNLVRTLVRFNIETYTPMLLLSHGGGAHAMDHELNIARAVIAKDGIHCLHKKEWREIAWELRFPPPIYGLKYDGRSRTNFIRTLTGDNNSFDFIKSSLIDVAQPRFLLDREIMLWLGFAWNAIDTTSHREPHWTPPSIKEQLGDIAVVWDRTDTSAWAAENQDRHDSTTEWWPVMIGAAFWFASDDTRTLTIGSDSLTSTEAINFIMAALRLWTSPQSFFLAVQPATKVRLDANQLCSVSTGGSPVRIAAAVSNTMWTEWRFTSYQAALAEGKKLT